MPATLSQLMLALRVEMREWSSASLKLPGEIRFFAFMPQSSRILCYVNFQTVALLRRVNNLYYCMGYSRIDYSGSPGFPNYCLIAENLREILRQASR